MSEKSRARNAESAMRQQEKNWTLITTRLRENQDNRILTNMLPADIQSHMEATIDALRLQVSHTP